MNWRWLTIPTLAALAVACSGLDQEAVPTPTAATQFIETPIAAGTSDPLVIGVSVDLTDEGNGVGEDLADAVELAIEDAGSTVAGRPLQSARMDDGCNDPEQAEAAADGLVATVGLAGVIGPMCATGAQAANDVYEGSGVVHISPASTRADLSALGQEFFFRVAWRDDAQGRIQAQFVFADGGSAVVVDDGEAYGRALADAFVDAAPEASAILARERLERGASDYRALARQVTGAEPDTVVFEGFDPEAAIFLRDLRAEGFDGQFVGPDSLLSLNAFVVPAGEAAEGAIITAGRVPDQAFTDRFLERFGRQPSTPFVLQAYDAARVLIAALESQLGESDSSVLDRRDLAQGVRDANLFGLTGPVSFDQQGDRAGDEAAEQGLAIYRVNGGRFELIE